jgi:drug/metabolite transporter (DMT)-like permease
MARRSWLLFAALCIIWGIPYLLIRVVVRDGDISPGTLVFARTAIGALLLTPVAISRGALRPVLRRWRPLLVYTAIEVAAPWLFLSDAETKLSSSLTGLLVAAVPLVGAVLGRTTGDRERLEPRRVVGLLVGIAGVAALVGLDLGSVDLPSLGGMGVVIIGYAVGPVILARSLGDLPALGVVAASLALCALGYLPVAVIHLPGAVPGPAVLASVLLLAVVCTAVAFLVFFALIAEVGPSRSTVFTYVNPAVAVVLGVVLLDESLTLATGIGFVLVIAGSVLATRRRTPRAAPDERAVGLTNR